MKKAVVFLLLLAVLLSACGAKGPYETEFFAMDTVMQLRLYGAQDAPALAKDVIREIGELESTLSVTKDDSEVARLNRGESITPGDTLSGLLDATLALSRRTDGCLDPTIYPIVKLWGFTTGEYRVPSEDARHEALSLTGIDHIHNTDGALSLDPGCAMDFGAVAKGFGAGKCAELVEQAGACGILTLGGNIQTVGSKPDGTPWKIGVTDPDNSEQSIAVLTLEGSNAVVTSGGYQRYFDEGGIRYSHIMDPMTGASVQNEMRSVTIVADDGFLADGLSTALYVMGMEKATAFWQSSDDFEMVLITDEGIFVSEGLRDRFSCEKDYEVISR